MIRIGIDTSVLPVQLPLLQQVGLRLSHDPSAEAGRGLYVSRWDDPFDIRPEGDQKRKKRV
jgi:hypothetical protein